MAVQQGGVAVCDQCGAWEPVILLSAMEDGGRVDIAFDPARFPPKAERQWRMDAPRIVGPAGQGAKLLCPACQPAAPAPGEAH